MLCIGFGDIMLHKYCSSARGTTLKEKWYNHKPQPVLESDIINFYGTLWSTQTNHLIQDNKPDIVVLNKEVRTCPVLDVDWPFDSKHQEKRKKWKISWSEKNDYMDLEMWEHKKSFAVCSKSNIELQRIAITTSCYNGGQVMVAKSAQSVLVYQVKYFPFLSPHRTNYWRIHRHSKFEFLEEQNSYNSQWSNKCSNYQQEVQQRPYK